MVTINQTINLHSISNSPMQARQDHLVCVWLPGEKAKMHVHLLKSDFTVFGSPSPPCRRRTFCFPKSIMGEASIPNFLKSIFSTVFLIQSASLFCPCMYE